MLAAVRQRAWWVARPGACYGGGQRGGDRMTEYDDDQIDRILLEGQFVFTDAELCEKWGITAYRLRKWRKERPCRWTLEDCLIAAIYQGEWHEPASFVEYLDWRNHAVYTPDEIEEMFQNLLAAGDVETDGGRYRYVQRAPPYIFGPPAPAVRRLGEADTGNVEQFLQQTPTTTMFLRSNLRAAGMTDRPTERFEGAYVGVFERGMLTGVVGHFWNGMLLMQSSGSVARAARFAVETTGLSITGMSGEFAQVERLAAELGLAGAARQLDAREVLYELPLADLVVPTLLARDDVTCRPPRLDELEVVCAWRRDYQAESLNDTTSPVEDSMRRSIEDGSMRVLEVDGELVAMTAFNAALPDMVQVGGVWTPPALRGRGFARAVVAGHLRDARDGGVQTAILFTAQNNEPAQRAYAALGFRKVGDYGLLLFGSPVTLALV